MVLKLCLTNEALFILILYNEGLKIKMLYDPSLFNVRYLKT